MKKTSASSFILARQVDKVLAATFPGSTTNELPASPRPSDVHGTSTKASQSTSPLSHSVGPNHPEGRPQGGRPEGQPQSPGPVRRPQGPNPAQPGHSGPAQPGHPGPAQPGHSGPSHNSSPAHGSPADNENRA